MRQAVSNFQTKQVFLDPRDHVYAIRWGLIGWANIVLQIFMSLAKPLFLKKNISSFFYLESFN